MTIFFSLLLDDAYTSLYLEGHFDRFKGLMGLAVPFVPDGTVIKPAVKLIFFPNLYMILKKSSHLQRLLHVVK